MTFDPQPAASSQRPDCMIVLGLLPPYTEEDVQKAYREKAKAVHPDRGGDAARFVKLQEAYEQGLEYARFHASRRQWLAARVEEYVRREALVAEVERRGGFVEYERIDWLRRELGDDFAQVTDKLSAVHLCGKEIGDEAIAILVAQSRELQTLTLLDFSHSRISDRTLGQLNTCSGLRRLDLRDTPISTRGLRQLLPLPDLEWLHVGGTNVGWWGRAWLWWVYPHLEVATR